MNRKPRGFAARKTLGQNFLHDENMVRKIARAIAPRPEDHIVEVGPGFGILTGHILESGCTYTGIELDTRLVPELQNRFGGFSNFRLVQQDFRKVSLSDLATDSRKLRLVGNIPYNITSSVIFKAIESSELVKDMILMVQREVGERIVAAPPGKAYGILSVLSQTYSRPTLLFTVPPAVFVPRPDVESAVVHWDFTAAATERPDDAEHHKTTVKTAFNQRRKQLRNGLKKLVDTDSFSQFSGIDLTRRPEQLSVPEFVDLSNQIIRFSHTHLERS